MDNNRRIILIAVFAYAFISGAYALNLGAVAKNDAAYINAGDSARFSLLFWSTDEMMQNVTLSAEVPEGWASVIIPPKFQLSSVTGKEFFSLGSERVRAVPVEVLVVSSGPSGEYDIKIKASAGLKDGDISFFQERVLHLKVYARGNSFLESLSAAAGTGAKAIEGAVKSTVNVSIGPGIITTETAKIASNENSAPDDGLLFFAAAVIAIIILSVMIYRR